ncbi:MAG TPA: hypothetical protein VLC95_13355 [Anaerolineae bacterium]|nr:hypothetical protein [Anaerolineae bacterium]
MNEQSTRRRAGAANLAHASTVLLFTLLVALAGVVAAGSRAAVHGGHPQLVIDASIGADLEAVTRETWNRFLVAFDARTGCFGDVHVRAAWELESRAAYDPETATVTVRVPGTRAMLQSALVHEWAHHVEFQCPAHETLRPAFLAAQRLAPGTPWRPDTPPADVPASEWAGIPSEQCAEAAIEVVLGGRPVPTNVRLTREAVQVVQEWASGDE